MGQPGQEDARTVVVDDSGVSYIQSQR